MTKATAKAITTVAGTPITEPTIVGYGVGDVPILRGIPVPTEVKSETRGRPSIYPWNRLEVGEIGDAFPIEEYNVIKTRNATNVKNREKVHEGSSIRFKVGQAEDGNWYCWRVS